MWSPTAQCRALKRLAVVKVVVVFQAPDLQKERLFLKKIRFSCDCPPFQCQQHPFMHQCSHAPHRKSLAHTKIPGKAGLQGGDAGCWH